MQADVVIHPFGEVDGNLINAVRTAIEQSFGVKATVGATEPVPANSYSHERGQYQSAAFLDALAALSRADSRVRLGIATVDLFVPELNFVFGEASSARRSAVFSTARLGGRGNGPMVVRRAVTEALHELGHVWGLAHCSRRDCVMWFSNTLAETDRKGIRFCRQCTRRLL
jgi:archaemetzincin